MPSIELHAEVQALRDRVHMAERKAESYSMACGLLSEQLCNAEKQAAHYRHESDGFEGLLIRATHMAALWKRCAKKYHRQYNMLYPIYKKKCRFVDNLADRNERLEERSEAAEAELAALKNDARHVSEYLLRKEMTVPKKVFEAAQEAARRIVEATKEGA